MFFPSGFPRACFGLQAGIGHRLMTFQGISNCQVWQMSTSWFRTLLLPNHRFVCAFSGSLKGPGSGVSSCSSCCKSQVGLACPVLSHSDQRVSKFGFLWFLRAISCLIAMSTSRSTSRSQIPWPTLSSGVLSTCETVCRRVFGDTGCCIELVLFHWGVWQQKFLLQPTPLFL